MQWHFSKYILLSKHDKTVFSGEMATNGRKRYFNLTKTLVERADEVDIDNLMNDCDTNFTAEEDITQTVSTQDASLTTPVANLDVVPNDNQSEKKEKNKKQELWKWTKKV